MIKITNQNIFKLGLYMTLNGVDISEFDEDFIKIYNNDSDEGYFLEAEVQYPENLHNF